MSTGNGNWDNVKGFFRRKTQNFSQNYRNASHTNDPQIEQNVGVVFEMQKKIRSLNTHMGGLCNAYAQSVSLLGAVKDDLNGLGQCNLEGVGSMAKCMELAITDLRAKVEQLSVAVGKDVESRQQFDKNADSLRLLLEDRRSKLLEFDFFKNKLADLRAKPPSDAARIPRNEGRVNEWGKAYEDANERVRLTCQQLISGGARLATTTSNMIVMETGKYYDESARTARAVLLGQGMQQAVSGAMNNATAAAAVVGTGLSASGAAMAQQVASKAAYLDGAASATSSAKIPSLPGSSSATSEHAFHERPESMGGDRSSQRFSVGPAGDDPFAV